MTWAPLLLADPSPCLRRLVLRQLLGRPEDDAEVLELDALCDQDPLVSGLLALQAADGSWPAGEEAWAAGLGPARGTALALIRLGYLGYGPAHPAVRRAAEYLFSCQLPDGAWALPVGNADGEEQPGYSMIPLQTAIPLRGLASCGYAADPRAEDAYRWLLARRLPDGAWPTGIASGVHGRVAGYRRLAHSRWGCRSNTTGALICLALHPERRHGAEAQRALDLLLGSATREEQALGHEVSRVIGLEPFRGTFTFYARCDPALALDLCRRVGAGPEDDRVAELVAFVQGLQGPYGLWSSRAHPQAGRWVTFDLLRSLSALDGGGGLSDEPLTHFQPYPRRDRRY